MKNILKNTSDTSTATASVSYEEANVTFFSTITLDPNKHMCAFDTFFGKKKSMSISEELLRKSLISKDDLSVSDAHIKANESQLSKEPMISPLAEDEKSTLPLSTEKILSSHNKIKLNTVLDNKIAELPACNLEEGKAAVENAFPYTYEAIYPILSKAREESSQTYQAEITKVSERLESGKVPFKAIDVDPKGRLSLRGITKSSGYDENFRCETLSQLHELDKNFFLKNSLITFDKAFKYSRLPTHSYIHFKQKTESADYYTTGHSGGFFKSLDDLQEYLKKYLGIKEKPPYSLQVVRDLSLAIIEKLSSTQGENKVGSVGKKPGFFHSDRQLVIEAVIKEAILSSEQIKKVSPLTATIEALKFVVNNTVSYKENTIENRMKFKGITTDGLNLEDHVSREYAMKNYQAVRDAIKLAILKHEGKLDKISSSEISEEIEQLNILLSKTVLEEKYHRKIDKEKRNLSPLRYVSPYSKANINYSLFALKKAKDYEEISSVYNTPIPVLRPTKELFT